jgi:hypothetical protein
VVDSAWGVGSGAALALDASGKAHISYYDAVNLDLKYATNKAGWWETQTVAWSGDVGRYSDIAIDGWGDPSIVYFNASTAELRYTNYDSSIPAWNLDEKIDTAYSPGHNGWFSFALDTGAIPNQPHVSYYLRSSSTVGEMKYAHYDTSNNWTSGYVATCIDSNPTNCKIGEYNSLALDPATNRPVIALSYYDNLYSYALLTFIVFDGTYWHTEVVDYDTPTYVSLAYDTAGATRKARLAWKLNGLKYAYRNGVDTWSAIETVDASASAGEWASLSVIGVTPHVVHYNTTSLNLIFVDYDRYSGWLAPYTVATQGHDVGDCSSLAVDSLGRLHTSYFDSTSGALKYLQYEIGVGAGVMNTIDSSGLTSCFSVIGVDATNNLAVGFIRGGNLYVSWLSGAYWLEPLLVDSVVSAVNYQGFGMALQSNGSPHFAYRKGNDLWYTYWTGGGWSRTLIVAGTAASRSVALALGPANTPSIAYYEGYILYHWTKNVLGWPIIEQIAGSGAGVGAAIAVNANGKVAAAYLDDIGMNLAFSSRSSLCNVDPPYTCIWTAGVVVDSQGEEFFSLAMDRRGTPHLAASVFLPDGIRLHYITHKGTAWVVQTVDNNPSTGWKPSIALSPSGRPRISYYDMWNRDLKIVFQLDQLFLPLVRR